MKYLKESQVLAYIESIEEESRQYNDGEVSYPYQAGAMKQMLINALTSDIMRDILIKQIEEID